MDATQELLPSAQLANLVPCSQNSFVAWALGQFLDLPPGTRVSCGHGQPDIKQPTNERGLHTVTPSSHLHLLERFPRSQSL